MDNRSESDNDSHSTTSQGGETELTGTTPLRLREGRAGRLQLWLYFTSIPFWFVFIWFAPAFFTTPAIIAVGATAIVVTLLAIMYIGSGIEERTRMMIITFSIPFWIVVMWYSYTQLVPRGQYGVAFLGGILILYIINELARTLETRDDLHTVLLSLSAIITVITAVYIVINYQRLAIDAVGRASSMELALAFAFTVVMVYLTWRAFGVTFVVVLIVGIGYAFAGPFMPGALSHGGISYGRTLRILVVHASGFFGFLTRLVAAWIALFLLYAGLLKAYGAFDLILRLAVRSAKYVDSGVAQTAVVASAIIGSVNGSQTANAGMTGAFTIPLMKRNGVKAETAGGIEAVASTSGQVLPPVMGAAAFIMASLISGISYIDVLIAGLIPAAILIITIVIAVHFVAAPQIENPEMEGVIDDTLSNFTLLLEGVKYGIPLLILIYALGIRQVTVMTAALWTVIAMLACGVGIPLIKAMIEGSSLGETALHTGKQTVDGFREGTLVLAPVAIILASINGVVDILMATGVPTAISLTLMDLSGGVMIIAVFMAMVICILLGLGMPTSAAYTVVAILVAPTLIHQFFVPEIAAHYFVFYSAILAGLTPPIATCVAVTTGISAGSFWGTCREAIKISAPLFVLPFAFIYHPELVSGEFTSASLIAGTFALVGSVAIIYGINYWFSFSRIVNIGLRVAFFVLGVIVMVHPAAFVQYGAVGGLAVVYVLQAIFGRPAISSVINGVLRERLTFNRRP